jgi:hypothetical protein
VEKLLIAYHALREQEQELQRKFAQHRSFGHQNVVSHQQRVTIMAYIDFYAELTKHIKHQDLAMTEAKLMVSLRMTFRDLGENWLADIRHFKHIMGQYGITLPEQ